MDNLNTAALPSGQLLLPAGLILLVILFLHLRGAKKFSSYAKALDNKAFPLAGFSVMGFSLMELIRYRYGTSLDRRLRWQMTELYTEEFSEFYLRAVWAQAATALLLGLLIGTLIYAGTADPVWLVLGAALAAALAWATFRDVDDKINKRHHQISIELPELTNQILILSGAGLTIRGAIIKIAHELPSDGPLYAALGKAVEKMELGATNEQAFDYLTATCNMPAVRRFVSVILQNLTRGGSDVSLALYEIGKELWDARRATAQRMAEETTTKLLFPMLFMLLSVILLVAAPAVMGMNTQL